MAVKASAAVTLSCVVDVHSVTRYYLLQASTLARPSAPTANPPGGLWTDAEPGYTGGSTNSLYLVDLTVFSDGSWSYSAVSLSSAYEAAKAAWNKANAAQSTASAAQSAVNALQVGGRNLIRDSSMELGGGWGSYALVSPTDGMDGGSCFKVTGALDVARYVTQTAAVRDHLVAEGYFKPGEQYVVSYWARGVDLQYGELSPTVGYPRVGFAMELQQDGKWAGQVALYNVIPEGTSDWTRYSAVVTIPTIAFNAVERATLYFRNYTGTVYIDKIQFERGNKLTDWTLAPEDTEASIEVAAMHVGAQPPPAPILEGKLWMDQRTEPPVLRQWQSGAWAAVNDPEVILTAQDELRARQSALEADTESIVAAMQVKPEGVYISRDMRKCGTYISDKDFNVMINRKIVSTYAASYVQIQNMQIRRPSVGGLAFSSVEGLSGVSM